jgi:hypothetical protein
MLRTYSYPDPHGSPFSRLLRHARGCRWPILIRILTGHLKMERQHWHVSRHWPGHYLEWHWHKNPLDLMICSIYARKLDTRTCVLMGFWCWCFLGFFFSKRHNTEILLHRCDLHVISRYLSKVKWVAYTHTYFKPRIGKHNIAILQKRTNQQRNWIKKTLIKKITIR